jgi:hypothetical protein
MTQGISIEGIVGNVIVHTTVNRGFTPEEIAERAIAKIISIGDKSHPLLQAQAHAFKDNVHRVLIHYLREAQQSERITICAQLDQQGLPEIATLIRNM